MRMKSVAFLLICTMLLSACATSAPQAAANTGQPQNVKDWVLRQNRGTRNAIYVSLLLSTIGAATGSGADRWKRAAAGAVAGAIIGYALGKRQDRLFAQRDFAVQQAQYDRSQGYIAKVESVTFKPAQAKPGQKTTLVVRYLVVGPNPNEGIKVRMYRGLKYGGVFVMGAGPNEFIVPRGGGIVEATMDVTLSEEAPQGTYDVEALIEDPAGRFAQVIGTSSLAIMARGDAPSRSAIAAR